MIAKNGVQASRLHPSQQNFMWASKRNPAAICGPAPLKRMRCHEGRTRSATDLPIMCGLWRSFQAPMASNFVLISYADFQDLMCRAANILSSRQVPMISGSKRGRAATLAAILLGLFRRAYPVNLLSEVPAPATTPD